MSGFNADAVSLIDNHPCAASLSIAEHFDKRRDAVLRDIRSLISVFPSSFTDHNFVASEYTDSTGRELPPRRVFFDGFILLVMGYTGIKAQRMKLAYIEAFNAIKAKLEAAKESETPGLDAILRAVIDAKVEVANREGALKRVLYAQAWNAYRRHFELGKNDRLPRDRWREAVGFVAQLEQGAGNNKIAGGEGVGNDRPQGEIPEAIDETYLGRFRKKIVGDLDRIKRELQSIQGSIQWQLYPTAGDAGYLGDKMDHFYVLYHLSQTAAGAVFTARQALAVAGRLKGK